MDLTNNYILESLLPDFRRFQEELNETVRLLAAERMKHLEAMTCAYFEETNIPASEVMLVEDHRGDHIVWYFAPKNLEGRDGNEPQSY